MERAIVCTNCGQKYEPWFHELLASQLVPFALTPRELAKGGYKCGRCRPRRDKGEHRLCRAVRDRYGLSQRHWSYLFGVDARTVVRWETGTPEPTGGALELLGALDTAAALNPGVISLVARQLRRNATHAQLFAELLLRAAGGVVSKRQRRTRKTAPDGFVLLTIRVSRGERARLAVNAFQRGQTVSDWVRSLLGDGRQAGFGRIGTEQTSDPRAQDPSDRVTANGAERVSKPTIRTGPRGVKTLEALGRSFAPTT